MKKLLQISNGVAFVSTIVINYLSNTGALNDTTIGAVSNGINSLFTPASYAFSIWGLIYLLLFGFIIYQGRSLFVKVRDDGFILNIGWWFVVSCVANSLWVVCWIYHYTGLSCLCIFLLLFSILKIIINNKMQLWDAPISVIAFLWWPFVIYSGWVTVASIANIASYLVKIEWNGFGVSESIWTIILIMVAVLINILVTWRRNMREFALVGAWALIAIAVANKDINQLVFVSAVISSVILIINSSGHAFINRSTNPIKKFQQYLKKSKA